MIDPATLPHVIVCGSRQWEPAAWLDVRDDIADFIGALPANAVVVTGGAPGVDAWASQVAVSRGLAALVLTPPWERIGLAAGTMRNQWLLDLCPPASEFQAFWDGQSPGTRDMIQRAEKCPGYRVHRMLYGSSAPISSSQT